MNILNFEIYIENNAIHPYCASIFLNNRISNFYYTSSNSLVEDVADFANTWSRDKNIEIYVHNLNLIGAIFIEQLTKMKLRFEIMSLEDNLYWIEFKYIATTIKFRCSYKILPLTLKKINELEKIVLPPFPYKYINKHTLQYKGAAPNEEYWNATDFLKLGEDELKTYNIQDVAIKISITNLLTLKKSLNSITGIIDSFDKTLLKNSYSAPSISFKIFFKYFNDKNIEKNLTKKHEAYTRPAYMGGRNEIFGNPNQGEIIKYYDFPGMYAQCMQEKFHNGRSEITSTKDINHTGFHTITYTSKNIDKPVLGCYSKHNGLVFANGTNTGTFWFEEILYFVENGGTILKKHHSLIYDRYENVFNGFVEHFNTIKQKGGYFKVFAKLVLNGLYGSLALKENHFHNCITFSMTEFEKINRDLTVHSFYKLNNVFIIVIIKDHKFKKIFKENIEETKRTRNVTYSAAIAAKARIKLHKLINEVEKNNGRVLHSNTDSIYAAYASDNLEKKIGQVEWLDFYEDAVFVNTKTYALKKGNKEKIKIRGIDATNISFKEFKESFYNDKNIENRAQISNFENNFKSPNKKNNKKINFEIYNKREFAENKKTTRPLNIDDPDIQ